MLGKFPLLTNALSLSTIISWPMISPRLDGLYFSVHDISRTSIQAPKKYDDTIWAEKVYIDYRATISAGLGVRRGFVFAIGRQGNPQQGGPFSVGVS
jgi:hypothetical protein